MKKIIIILLFVIFGIILAYFSFPNLNPVRSVILPTASPSESPTTTPKSIEKPVRIRIPKLSVDTLIEEVTTDNLGRMDIPKDYNNTGWYSLGPKPGEKGSAVIDGHVDTPDGKPSVFASIDTLFPGDIIEIEDKKGSVNKFEIVSSTDYKLDDIPLDKIFDNKINEARLNLITCSGAWDKNTKMYQNRFVVYAKLVE